MSTSNIKTTATKAIVLVRASRGGGEWVHPIRVYLLLVDVDAEGKPIIPRIATKARACTWIWENARATRRVRALTAHLEDLAAKVNAGQMTFEQARREA